MSSSDIEADREDEARGMNDFETRCRLDDEFMKLTLTELIEKTPKELSLYFRRYDTGIASFFWNQNTRLLYDDKAIDILEAMKGRKQRFFAYTLYNVLFYSKKVQEWAIENMKCCETNTLYITDDTTY
jgi:hypothetical protein